MYAFATRGGSYAGTPGDTRDRVRPASSSPSSASTTCEFVYAEGLAISEASKVAALSRAERTIEQLAAPERLAA